MHKVVDGVSIPNCNPLEVGDRLKVPGFCFNSKLVRLEGSPKTTLI